MFKCTPVCEVYLNHEVTKTWTGTSPELGSVAYSYVTIIYDFPRLLYLAAQFPPKGETHSCPSSHAIYGRPVCTRTGSSDHPDFPCIRPRIMKILRLAARCTRSSAHLSFSRLRPSLASPHHPSLPNVEPSSSIPLI